MSEDTQNILITGGAGYIGSHVAHLLRAQAPEGALKEKIKKSEPKLNSMPSPEPLKLQKKSGQYKLIVIDNLSTGFKEALPEGIAFYQEDLKTPKAIDKILKKENPKVIIHFAASIQVEESTRDPQKYYENNFLNTKNLIDLAISNNIKNFIFSSTAAVYGDGISGGKSKDTNTREITMAKEGLGPITEESPLNPLSPYGTSKLFSEKYIQDISKAHKNFHAVILRYFNVAGASFTFPIGQRTKNATHLIKICSEVALGKRPFIEVYGSDYDTKDGTCIRDFIHVDDLAMAHLKALEFLNNKGHLAEGDSISQKSSNSESSLETAFKKDSGLENKLNFPQIYNCGYEEGYSVLEVIRAFEKVSGKKFEIKEAPRRSGDAVIVIAGSQKIKRELDWKPQYNNLEKICKSALDWEAKI